MTALIEKPFVVDPTETDPKPIIVGSEYNVENLEAYPQAEVQTNNITAE